MSNKYLVGSLVLVVLVGSIYVFMPSSVKVNVGKNSAEFYVWDGNAWDLSGTEYVYLYKGTTKKYAKSRSVDYEVKDNFTTIMRTVTYENDVSVLDEYVFDGTTTDVEMFPIQHSITCNNCVGYILQYEVKNIVYDGLTTDITSPFSFGKNMRLRWDDGAYYSKVIQNKITSDKIVIKYRPTTDSYTKQIVLFDPDTCTYTTGDWYINCSESCTVSSPFNVGGNNIIAYGTGNVYVNSTIDDASSIAIETGCNIMITSAGNIGLQ